MSSSSDSEVNTFDRIGFSLPVSSECEDKIRQDSAGSEQQIGAQKQWPGRGRVRSEPGLARARQALKSN